MTADLYTPDGEYLETLSIADSTASPTLWQSRGECPDCRGTTLVLSLPEGGTHRAHCSVCASWSGNARLTPGGLWPAEEWRELSTRCRVYDGTAASKSRSWFSWLASLSDLDATGARDANDATR